MAMATAASSCTDATWWAYALPALLGADTLCAYPALLAGAPLLAAVSAALLAWAASPCEPAWAHGRGSLGATPISRDASARRGLRGRRAAARCGAGGGRRRGLERAAGGGAVSACSVPFLSPGSRSTSPPPLACLPPIAGWHGLRAGVVSGRRRAAGGWAASRGGRLGGGAAVFGRGLRVAVSGALPPSSSLLVRAELRPVFAFLSEQRRGRREVGPAWAHEALAQPLGILWI
ncbi:hypothetical protein ACP70R_034650 [Stipagrostis hirtigluma subsp. patula]